MTPATFPAFSTTVDSAFRLRSILVPTDFSDASDRAACLARGLARHFHAKLFLVHAVLQKDYAWDKVLFHLAPGEELGRRMTEEFVANHELDALPHKVIVSSGLPEEVVRSVAAENEIDLIVLGTNGLRGTSKLVFGPYSEWIFRNTATPVLTAGPHVRPSRCNGSFRSIVCAVDPEQGGAAAEPLGYAMALARACQAYLTVVHIVAEPNGARGDALYRLEEEKHAQISRMLSEHLPALPHEAEIIVRTGKIDDEIIKIAVGCGADLIVKGMRPPDSALAKGDSYPISVNAHCPVLSVVGNSRARDRA